jgi:hypothetical protein
MAGQLQQIGEATSHELAVPGPGPGPIEPAGAGVGEPAGASAAAGLAAAEAMRALGAVEMTAHGALLVGGHGVVLSGCPLRGRCMQALAEAGAGNPLPSWERVPASAGR